MLEALLGRWTAFIVRNAWPVLIGITLMTGAAAWFAIDQFHMNSDTSRLIKQDTEWKRTNDEFLRSFPQYDQNTFVVISGPGPAKVTAISRALSKALAGNDLFQHVYSPATSDFAEQNALLYLDPETLNNTISRLADAQPFLTAVAGDNSLRSTLDLLIDALESDQALPAGFTRLTDTLALAAEYALAGGQRPVAWRDELFQVGPGQTFYQVIFVQGQQNFGQDLPNARIIGSLRSTIDGLAHPYLDEVSIRLTGQVPLEHGEIVSAMDSAQLAGTLALAILVAVLIWGVRSLRIIAATYLSMLVGLIWTAAFAMLTVGSYNTISIIFLVMFIGLGVDFAVHLCLKYQETSVRLDKTSALVATGQELGPAIALCGVTSAMGFLAFVPTAYVGLAEMGIISGGGMIIAVVVSLTLIPAFFTVVKRTRPPTGLPFAAAISGLAVDRARSTAWATLALAVVLTAIASQATFDYSTLSLKDPDAEAMTTLRALQDEGVVTDYALSYVAGDMSRAVAVKASLEALDVVSEVRIPQDYLPDDQDEKQYLLEDASFLLASVFEATPISETFSAEARLAKLETLTAALTQRATKTVLTAELAGAMTRLNIAVTEIIAAEPAAGDLLTELVIPPLQSEIKWLERAIEATPVTLDDLPQDLRSRLITQDERVLVSITPAEDLAPIDAMRRFTGSVMSIVPAVTGRPVLDVGIGDIVVGAFLTAIALAVISIFAILLLTLKSIVDAVLVFIPLLMTAMLTLAVSVLIDLPLNMANVVVIPLIFGLGVDNGIHIVKRFHQSTDVGELVSSSTPKAVFLSNLTTLGTFCALSFSTHQGIYSIGVLLTVALTALMVLTLISLPALLATFSRPQHASR